MSSEIRDDECTIKVFIPSSICLHSVSVTCCYIQGPLVCTVNNMCGQCTDAAKTFRAHIYCPHRGDRMDQTDQKDEPGAVMIPARGVTQVISRRVSSKTEPVNMEIPLDCTTDMLVDNKMGSNGNTVSFGLS